MREQPVLLINTSLASWTAKEAAFFAKSLRFVEFGSFSDAL
jgi:hypothetical protein